MEFFITILVGMLGAGIGLKLKVPAGAMIGSLFSVAVFNILTDSAYLPESYKIITQISTGTFIGAKITFDDIKGLKKVFFPAFLMVVLMGVFNIFMGMLIHYLTSIDIVTALFATAPGGIADMTIISYDFGADSSKVAVLQLIRLISVVTIIPVIIKFLTKKYGSLRNEERKEFIYQENEKKQPEEISFSQKLKNTLITLCIGAVTGVVGFAAGIPAGAMSVSMTGVAVYNIFFSKAFMPVKLRQFIQVLAGAMIGAKMGMKDLLSLKEIAVPIFIIIFGFCLMNFLLGLLIYKITDFSIQTSFFSASPGGMSDMSIIASELGADSAKVAVMQFLRLVSVVAVYPIIISIIKDFFK